MSKPSLLVITSESPLSDAARGSLYQVLGPLGKELGMLVAVMDSGLKAEVHRDLSPLVEAIQAQTHAITQLVQQNAAMFQSMVEKETEESQDEPVGYLSLKRR